MSAPTVSMKESLPFDVLGEIFQHYADEETFEYPTETLLLVNRSWKEAALGHRVIWGKMKIILGHEPTQSIWKKRVPLRLARSGECPLDIELRPTDLLVQLVEDMEGWLGDEDTWEASAECDKWCRIHGINGGCRCCYEAPTVISDLLGQLAGPNGIHARRWNTLVYRPLNRPSTLLDLFGELDKEIERWNGDRQNLKWPTPRLRHLDLNGIILTETTWFKATGRLFPDAPNLQRLRIANYGFLYLPSASRIRDLEVEARGGGTSYAGVAECTNLTRLTLKVVSNTTSLPLPSLLPHLTSLELQGPIIPTSIYRLSAPVLKRLALTLSAMASFLPLLEAPLPFGDLEELEVVCRHTFKPGRDEVYSDWQGFTSALLGKMDHLRRIEGNREGLGLVVKVLWERQKDGATVANDPVTFVVNETKQAAVTQARGREDLVVVSGILGLGSPEVDWEEFWRKMER